MYDTAGNLIEKSTDAGRETRYYWYDYRKLVLSVRETSDDSTNPTVTYTYDAVGNQIQQDE
jgi:YD repeat-containing protein